MNGIGIFVFATIVGVGPALLWLWFWLLQDNIDPEPRKSIFFTFVAGMIAVPFVFPFESALFELYASSIFILFLAWAAVEEFIKLIAAYITGLTSKAMNEPVDAIVYMITAALGFAALENVLFLYEPLANGSIEETLITGNMRFIGANLLHVISSAIIGAGIALTYYKKPVWRILYSFVAILTAIALHTGFNFFIISSGTERIITVFGFIWVSIIVLIFIFQYVKYTKPENVK